METHVTKLKNGLTVVVTEMPSTETVTSSISVGVGSRHEDFDVNGGVSHFLEHLLFKGTKKRTTPRSIADAIESVGGKHNAYTSNEHTQYYVKVPRQHWKLSLDLLSDIIQNSTFDADELDRERTVVLEEMHMRSDNPAGYVHDLIPGLLWPHDSLGKDIIGTEKVIKTISRKSIMDFQKQHYQPKQMVVSVAGNVIAGDVFDEIKELMGGMKSQPVNKQIKGSLRLGTKFVQTDIRDSAQSHLLIGTHGFSHHHKHHLPAKVLSAVLGVGMSSRLFMNVRERKGLAYSIYAYHQDFTDTGQFGVYAGVTNEKIGDALHAVFHEFERVREKEISQKELDSAKQKIIGSAQMAFENTATVSDAFGTEQLLHGEIETLDEFRDKIEAVSSKQVQAVAQEILKPHTLRMSVITPDAHPAVWTFEKLISK